MPTKHAIVSQFSTADLRAYVAHYRLEVTDRRVRTQLIEALVECETATIGDILKDFYRDDLKALCRALDLDDSGRRKADLIARLIGKGEEPGTNGARVSDPRRESGRSRSGRGMASARTNDNGATTGYEAELWAMADKLRGNMEPSDYKHIALGLIFLKYISDAFERKRTELLNEVLADAEDPEEYLAENVFWVPKEARWSHLQAMAKQSSIGIDIDNAMIAIEANNASLKGVLPKDYARPVLNKVMLGELIDLVSKIGMTEKVGHSRDILGRIYEYFLGRFARAEGKRGGEFYTPSCVVQLLVGLLEPYSGRVYDPCCGSGGMFVQSEKFVEEHGGRLGDIAIYGQESNYTTWRLSKMNLAVRGIDADVRWNNEGSFHNDALKDFRSDFILANPPFNDSDWGGDRLTSDVRWKFGIPPSSNANFAWVQHFIHHLAPNGVAAFVLAIMSLSSENEAEQTIRKAIIDNDLVDCIITLPGKLFYTTPIPVCVWIIARDKRNKKFRDRSGETLFIDASKLGQEETRTHSVLAEKSICKIHQTYRNWRSKNGSYDDIAGFCRSVSIREIADRGYGLFPASFIEASPRAMAKLGAAAEASKNLKGFLECGYEESQTYRDGILRFLRDRAQSQIFPFSGALETWKVGELLRLSDERLGTRGEPEILTCTENAGLVLQRERFSKRVATEDTSKYKYVRFTDIVYNPYLLWAGAIDQCTVVDVGITSPAYCVFRVAEGFDPFIVGRALKTEIMLHKYDGISVGTVQRRRRAAPEKFLELDISLPCREEQLAFSQLTTALYGDLAISRTIQREVHEYMNLLVDHLGGG